MPCLFFALQVSAQKITYADPVREDSKDINFEVIGKIKGNILIFKNVRWKYAISVYDDNMQLKEKVPMDFMPDKTFNVNYVYSGDQIFMIYQYQKRGIVYCMSATLNQDAQLVGEPVQIDTTDIGTVGDNNIYSTISSEDRKRIMVFKIHKKNTKLHIGTLLFNNQMKLDHRTRFTMDFNERKEIFSDFLIDNDGNLVFTRSSRINNRDNFSAIEMMVKSTFSDTLKISKFNTTDIYTDDVKLKIDNFNKKYIANSFFYSERRGNINGVYTVIWNALTNAADVQVLNPFTDSLRAVAKSTGSYKFAFNDFFIKNIIVKKDGGFLLAAEDFTSQVSGGNNWNRWDYLYNSPFVSPFNSFYYNPYYFGYNDWGGFYRPFNSFNSVQNTRYYYDNVVIISISKTGETLWSTVIQKQQYYDNNDNYLSYCTMNMGGEIHFLFNMLDKRDKFLSDQAVDASGIVQRNPTIKSYLKGYEFMPRFAKQIGTRQIIVPCTYRSQISFAKIDF
jgi:hypothetical protein